MPTPFNATKDDLNKLDPAGAVDLIRDLVRLEASASNIRTSAIDMSYNIHSRDGGIDGAVRDAANDGTRGIIKKGTTMYQIKSGKFTHAESDIRKILFKNKPELKDGIKACFEAGGTLVVAFTGWDAPDPQGEPVEEEFRRQSKEAGHPNARIEVWRQNTLIGFLKSFPSLELSVKYLSNIPLRLHKEWGGMGDMKRQIHLGREQRRFIDHMRETLRNSSHTHIRVSGDPGIGKTRLVLEATDTDDLRPAVIYVDKPSDLQEQGFMRYICRAGQQTEAILVVDECDSGDQALIWNDLKGSAPNIRLITIFAEEDSPGQTTRMPAPPLEDTELEKIIRGYVGNDPSIRNWIGWCRPSPRAAHVVGENLRYNRPDLLRPPDEVDVWGRYIAGRETSEEKIETRRKILLWLSLFKRFGFESPYGDEAGRIAGIVEREEDIPRGEFMSTIKALRKRKILQGSTTLYITPKLLHLHLWLEWWDTYDAGMFPKPEDLIPKMQGSAGADNLFAWSLAMFAHGKLSPKVTKVVQGFLAPGGPMESSYALESSWGADYFLTFSKVAPADALGYLKRTICKRSRDDLLKFRVGRPGVVYALERMICRGEHFNEAARVLLKLAEAENEERSNNATGVFQGMFDLSHPAATPDDKIQLLKEAMGSGSPSARAVAVGACNAALEGGGFTIFYDTDDIEPVPQPRSTNRDEEIRYRRQVLDILEDHDGDV